MADWTAVDAPRPNLDQLALTAMLEERMRAGHWCARPRCGRRATHVVYVANRRRWLVGREWVPGQCIDLCEEDFGHLHRGHDPAEVCATCGDELGVDEGEDPAFVPVARARFEDELRRPERVCVWDCKPPVSCAHCGRPTRTLAGGHASVSGQFVCHPDEFDRPDCYRLATVYRRPLGELLWARLAAAGDDLVMPAVGVGMVPARVLLAREPAALESR